MKRIALIVAGGKGTRMGNAVPKQFMELVHKPVLMHTLEKFRYVCDKIILVLPEDQIAYWEKLCSIYHFSIPHQIVAGGETRLHSVYNGLQAADTESVVAIHDGARPLVDEAIIKYSFDEAEKNTNAICAVQLKDSIREIEGEESFARNRSRFVMIQTPQTFTFPVIFKAYRELMQSSDSLDAYTDDASVAERDNIKIHLMEGHYENIKITTREDLIIAEAILRSRE